MKKLLIKWSIRYIVKQLRKKRVDERYISELVQYLEEKLL